MLNPPDGSPKPLRLLRLPDVVAKVGMQRDSIYRGVREGWFPAPVKLSQRASAWIESEIDAMIEKRASERVAKQPAQ
jgi:prophage regulatory protein